MKLVSYRLKGGDNRIHATCIPILVLSFLCSFSSLFWFCFFSLGIFFHLFLLLFRLFHLVHLPHYHYIYKGANNAIRLNVFLWLGFSRKRVRYITDFKLNSTPLPPLPPIKLKTLEIFQVSLTIWCLTSALTYFPYNEPELVQNMPELSFYNFYRACKRVLSAPLASFPLKQLFHLVFPSIQSRMKFKELKPKLKITHHNSTVPVKITM